MRFCKLCKSTIKGRQGKIFCTVKCKSSYHYQLNKVTEVATDKIDKILHRNRSILLEIMGKHKTQIKLPIMALEKKKFNFNYITKYYVNSRGKTYNYVYDFSWMVFSDNEVLILRRKSE
jgi:hypothetical protein